MMKKFGTISFFIILTTGWAWIQALQPVLKFTDQVRVLLLILLSGVLIFRKIMESYPPPASLDTVERRRNDIEHEQLQGLHNLYMEKLKKITHEKNTTVPIWINIMFPARWWTAPSQWLRSDRRLPGAYLKNIYRISPSTIKKSVSTYSDPEINMHWGKGEMTWGRSWQKHDRSFSDAKNELYIFPDRHLTAEQKALIQSTGVVSTLSCPIKYNNKVIGVLNLESTSGVDKTLFNHEEIITLVIESAEILAQTLNSQFENGVEG